MLDDLHDLGFKLAAPGKRFVSASYSNGGWNLQSAVVTKVYPGENRVDTDPNSYRPEGYVKPNPSSGLETEQRARRTMMGLMLLYNNADVVEWLAEYQCSDSTELGMCTDIWESSCPVCGELAKEGHAETCELNRWLDAFRLVDGEGV